MNESLSFRNSKLLKEVSIANAIYLRFPEHTHHPYDSSMLRKVGTPILKALENITLKECTPSLFYWME